MLLLPLQWGGNQKAWNDPVVIGLLAGVSLSQSQLFGDERSLHGLKQFGAMLILFVLWEWYKGKYAMMPLHMFKNRTQAGASLEIFFIFFCFLLGVGV